MTDYLEALERLGRLRELNVLSDAEFEAEKSRILQNNRVEPEAASATVVETAPSRIKKLAVPIGAAAVALVIAASVYIGASSTSKTDSNGKPPRRAQETDVPSGAAEPRISSILKFDVPSECVPGENLKVLIDDLRTLDAGASQDTLQVPGTTAHVRPRVERIPLKDGGGAVIAELTIPGAWEGLKVSGVRTSRFEGTDMYTVQIRFQDGPEKVRRVLNDQGFDISKVGDLKTVDLDSGALMIGVEGVEGGSALTCAHSGKINPTSVG